jgi:hypothetical protein
MRALSYLIAVVFILTGPSLAGSSRAHVADQRLPGIGTFAYSGSPITIHAIQVVVALGH